MSGESDVTADQWLQSATDAISRGAGVQFSAGRSRMRAGGTKCLQLASRDLSTVGEVVLLSGDADVDQVALREATLDQLARSGQQRLIGIVGTPKAVAAQEFHALQPLLSQEELRVAMVRLDAFPEDPHRWPYCGEVNGHAAKCPLR